MTCLVCSFREVRVSGSHAIFVGAKSTSVFTGILTISASPACKQILYINIFGVTAELKFELRIV